MGGWCGEDSVSRAIGGYVRRCERKPSGPTVRWRPVQRSFPYPEPPVFQCMPILRFEPFDVDQEDVTETIDPGVMDVVASFYADTERTKRPDPRGR